MMRTLPAMVWIALALPAGARAAEADRIAGPDPAEVQAYKGAANRFHDRMEELAADTADFVAMREEEERAKLVTGYDAVLASLTELEESQRQLVIDRFEGFLERYPDASYSNHVRFRLADLHYETASLAFLEQRNAYYEAVESGDLETLASMSEPYKDLARPIELYQRIIEDNRGLPPEQRYERLDGVYLMLGFCYADETSAQRDPAKAREAYTALIEELPDSDLADRSHLFLGNYLFEEGKFEEAVAEYTFVYDKGEEGKYYLDAMYQLAWAHYKENRFEEATALFLKLLDRSQEIEAQTGKQSPFAPDAIKYMAYSFADIANQDARSAVGVATDFFDRVGPREYEWDIYNELAEVLLRYYRFDEAIETYVRLQEDPRWVNRPENPGFQIAVVKLYARPEMGDLAASGAARMVLTERYKEGGEWWEANRDHPEALTQARAFIEDSLIGVAIEYYIRADETGDADQYLVAANKFKEYLDKFPIADDYYDQQWLLANAYRLGGAFEEAEREYSLLEKSSKYHDYGDGVIYFLMQMRHEMMTARSGPPDQVPVGAKVIGTRPTADGGEIPVYELSEDRLAFIEAADRVLSWPFEEVDPDSDELDIRASVEANRPALMYIPAQIYFYHGHYDEARKRLLAVIDDHNRSQEASFAAALLVNSYLNEGDLEQVRAYSKRFTLNPPGPLADEPDEQFLQTLEGSSFKLAGQLAEKGDYEGAAEAFLAYVDEFPLSEYTASALHNAAFYYQESGKNERANQLYEQFVTQYPSDERARILYSRIATNYEEIFELDKAVRFYEELRRRFPEGDDARDALYNASFLRIGLGDHAGAARGFEEYARSYPDAPDREKVHWMAGEQWEQVSDAKALAFYQGYLREYGTESPDHAMEAQHRIAQIYLRQGRTRAYEKQLDEVVRTFEEVQAAGKKIGPLGHRYAAASEFRELQEMYDDLVDDELTGKDAVDKELLNDLKPKEVKAFEERTNAFVSKYKSFEHNTHALYLQAMGVLYLADLGLSIKIPDNLTEDERWALEDILQTQVFPQFYAIEEVGVRKLSDLVEGARKQKRHSRWIDAAYDELNRREPLDFPAVKQEIRGIPSTSVPIRVAPVQMPEPEGPWGEGGGGEADGKPAGEGSP